MAEYKSCDVCAFVSEDLNGPHCGSCSRNYIDKFKRANNADRIRNMTDEELAHELVKHHTDDGINFCKNLKECDGILARNEKITGNMCDKCLLEWLRK